MAQHGALAFLRSTLLGGRSVRLVVTMGMPAPICRMGFWAHSAIGPMRETLVGAVESEGGSSRAKWLDKLREPGRRGNQAPR